MDACKYVCLCVGMRENLFVSQYVCVCVSTCIYVRIYICDARYRKVVLPTKDFQGTQYGLCVLQFKGSRQSGCDLKNGELDAFVFHSLLLSSWLQKSQGGEERLRLAGKD